MTGSRPDLMLAGDLVALAEDNRRELHTVDETLPSQGAYRDDRLGVEARRDELANLRRIELATLPLALANVFVHRVQRAAAGAVAVAATMALFVVAARPWLQSIALEVVPDLTLSSGIALVGCAALATYVVAGWIAERVFARSMRAAVVAGGDPHADLDRLAEGPIEVARGLNRRVDGWAVALGIAGIVAVGALLGSVTAFDLVGRHHPLEWVRTMHGAAESLGRNALGIATLIGLAAVPAALVGRACRLEHRRDGLPRWARALAHRATLVAGLVIGGGLLFAVLRIGRQIELTGTLPSTGARGGMIVAGLMALGFTGAWLVLAWRRREHAAIGVPIDRAANGPLRPGITIVAAVAILALVLELRVWTARRHTGTGSSSSVATLRISLSGVPSADVVIDGERVAEVVDGSELAVTGGFHDVSVEPAGRASTSPHGPYCTARLMIRPGKVTTWPCAVTIPTH